MLQQEKNVSAITLNKFYHDNKSDVQTSSTQHKQVLNINFAKPKLLITDNISPALQNSSSKLHLKRITNFVSDPATRVRLTINNSALATRMYHSNLHSPNTINWYSEHALRVRLTLNNATVAKQKPT